MNSQHKFSLIRFLPLVALCCASLSQAAIADKAAVYLHADPGSWVGGAVGAPQATWTHGDTGVFFGRVLGGSTANGVSINYEGRNYWTFEFAAPRYDPVTNTSNGQILHTGLYDRASRYPFNSPTRPGLSVYGNGRGNNELYGWFNVLEFGYDSVTGDVERFAVDFRQYDEAAGPTGPSLYGSLRFNSDIALNPVPEPASCGMLLGGLAVIAARMRRRQAGTSRAG